MPIKLTWSDLVIEDSTLDHEKLLADWRWLVEGQYRVIAGSKFGDWFIQRPSGAVELLDAMEGTLRQLAPTLEQFQQLLNTREKQEEWLLSLLVLTLHEKNIIPGAGECYAFKVPPVLGGRAESDNVHVMHLAVWVSLCGQLHQQLQALPPGTKINGFEVVK